MLGQLDCVLEDHGFHMLEPVEACGLLDGVKLVSLLVPLLSAKLSIIVRVVIITTTWQAVSTIAAL